MFECICLSREDDPDPIDAINPKSTVGGLATFYDVAVPDEDTYESPGKVRFY